MVLIMRSLPLTSLVLAVHLFLGPTATAQPGNGDGTTTPTCEICGCDTCPPGYEIGNPAGLLNLTQDIIDQFGDIPLPGGDEGTIATQLALLGIVANTVVPCSLLNTAATSGLLPPQACVDTLRLNPLLREACDCPPVPALPESNVTTTSTTAVPTATVVVVPPPTPIMTVVTTSPVMATDPMSVPTTESPTMTIDLGENTFNLPVLTIVGVEGTLGEADFPLAKCQGDCNRNVDCDSNLMCFSRGGATSIPGCFGRAALDGTDYCWDPADRPVEGMIAHVGNNGNPAVLFPLSRCAGQCTSDDDCQSGLICLFRDRVNDPVYGCAGPLVDRVDYCIDPNDLPGGSDSSSGISNNGTDVTSTNSPTAAPTTPSSDNNSTNATTSDAPATTTMTFAPTSTAPAATTPTVPRPPPSSTSSSSPRQRRLAMNTASSLVCVLLLVATLSTSLVA